MILLDSIHDVLQYRLHMFSYKLRGVYQLEDRDYETRLVFAVWCLQA